MRDSHLATIVSGFLFGVLVRSFLFVSIPIILLLVLISFIFLVSYFLFHKKNLYLLLMLGCFAFALGLFRFHISDKPVQDSLLFPYNNQYVELHGEIASDPEHKEGSTDFMLEVKKVGKTELPHSESVLIRDGVFSEVKYGDEVIVSGVISQAESFMNDLGKTFDYVSYLKKDGIDFISEKGKVEILSSDNGFYLKEKLFDFKSWITRVIDRTLKPPESSLLSGILLGTKSSLGKELRQEFVNTGTIHIVALSGYNVTIVAEAVMAVFSKLLPFFVSIGAGIFAIILFALMTGAGSTVVRASVMAILVLVARATGRAADIGRALGIAGFCMILINPWILVFDISFQLSFLATIGLVYLTPKVEPYFKRFPDKWGIRTIIASTIATNIFVLPFLVYQMGILSLVALPANVLILPLMPLSMLLGVLTTALAAISPLIAFPVVFVAHAILAYVLSVIHFLAKLPFAAVSINNVPLILIIFAYSGLLYIMFFHKSKIDKVL